MFRKRLFMLCLLDFGSATFAKYIIGFAKRFILVTGQSQGALTVPLVAK